jgi:carbon-monoxide dehydrogenase iron sulfur subunit
MTEHSISKDPVKAFFFEKPKPVSFAFVEHIPPLAISTMCRHCQEAECLEACKNGSIKRDEGTGRIEIDQDKCLGCGMCIMACPYGAIIFYRRNGRNVAGKCDLCAKRDLPACVSVCPNRALVFEDRG